MSTTKTTETLTLPCYYVETPFSRIDVLIQPGVTGGFEVAYNIRPLGEAMVYGCEPACLVKSCVTLEEAQGHFLFARKHALESAVTGVIRAGYEAAVLKMSEGTASVEVDAEGRPVLPLEEGAGREGEALT